MKLLIVEDEPAIADVIGAYARREGYRTRWAADGEAALELWEDEPFDLVLLDLMLPKLSGEEVCRHIRARSGVPIVMLTARGSENDIIAGLDAGADDYVVKPFSPRVLMARIRASLRKNGETQGDMKNVVRVGPRIEIDPNRVEIRKDGQPVSVTRNEFLIFSTLATPPIRTWSRDEIIRTALGDEYDGFDRTVDTYIKNLRKKLAEPGYENGWIQTVHGFGYKIDDTRSEQS
jgi:DNA-binding response OmpR family regulator